MKGVSIDRIFYRIFAIPDNDDELLTYRTVTTCFDINIINYIKRKK